MGVTVINQPTTAAERTNWIVKWLMKLAPSLYPSPVTHPHNALQSKPWAFEWSYNVSVSRSHLEDYPSGWDNQEHWSPLYIKRNASKSKRVMIYYHGGGFVNEMVPPQWGMIGRLGRELEADVVVQTYVMAPHGGIHDNLDRLVWAYDQIRRSAKEQDQEVILFGDSAGGCITASMLLFLNDKNVPLPDQAVLLSPCLMMTYDFPENRAIELYDPILTVDKFSSALHGWATGPMEKEKLFKPLGPLTDEDKEKMKHPYAAPLFGDWRFLAEKKVPLTICQGTYDILLPQCDRFMENAKSLDLDVTYIRADKAAHDYPMMADLPFASYLAPDSIEGLNLMVESVKRYSSTS